ncbi:MAG TPA: hypothetical protein VN605_14075 [Thermoanaerobaculia bacterium]|nr:hypothetical protein [Thermoanaerobaculia bacterium]
MRPSPPVPDAATARPSTEPFTNDFLTALALAAVAIVGAGATAPLGEARDWRAFFAAGTLFPLLVVLLNVAPGAAAARRGVGRVALAIGAVVAIGLIALHSGAIVLAAAGLAFLLLRRTFGTEKLEPALVIVLLVAWAGAFTAIWWFGPLWRLPLTYCLAVVVGTYFASLLTRGGDAPETPARRMAARLVAWAAPIVFLLAGLRTDQVATAGSAHHWSFLIGPAELMRQGGWLLWSLPSQYGFLSVLALAAIPAPNRWQALFLLNAMLLAASATLCFYLLQRLRPDATGRLISLIIAGTAVFLIAGGAVEFSGPMQVPSTGALRFVWAYAILGIVLWNVLGDGRRTRATLVLGAILWAAGAIWAFESFAYVCAAWTPAAVLLGLSLRRSDRIVDILRSIVPALLGPAILAAIIALLEVVYRVRLGHGPDYRSYWEFASAYSASFGTLPAHLIEPWIALALVLVLGAAVAAPLIRERDFGSLAGVAAAWGVMWSTASYYVARSHPNNATNVFPIAITCLAALMLIARRRLPAAAPVVLAIGTAFTSVVLIILFGNLPGAIHAARNSGALRTDVSRELPLGDEWLKRLLLRNDASGRMPVAFLWITAAPLVEEHVGGRVVHRTRPSLIPAIPSILIDAIPAARQREYLDRFMAETGPAEALLVRYRGPWDLRLGFSHPSLRSLADQDQLTIGEILRFYHVTSVDQEQYWELFRLQRRDRAEPLQTVLESLDAELTHITRPDFSQR